MAKSKIKTIFFVLLQILYVFITTVIIISLFFVFYKQCNSTIYAIAAGGISATILDISCSVLEDIVNISNKALKKKRIKNQKLKLQQEEEEKKKQQELIDYNDKEKRYIREVRKIRDEFKKYKEDIGNMGYKKKMSPQIKKKVDNILSKMQDIIDILKDDALEYYSIRYTFKVYFPKFQEITYNYLSLLKTNSISSLEEQEYYDMAQEFENYLDYIKSKINKGDLVSLSVNMSSLKDILQSEKEKENA